MDRELIVFIGGDTDIGILESLECNYTRLFAFSEFLAKFRRDCAPIYLVDIGCQENLNRLMLELSHLAVARDVIAYSEIGIGDGSPAIFEGGICEYFRLPVHSSVINNVISSLAIPQSRGRYAVGEKKKLLIVDDNEIMATELACYCELYFDLKIVTDPQKSLDVCIGFSPDVISLDIVMPGLNGFDVFDQLRSGWEGRPVFVFSSSQCRTMQMAKIYALGASHVTKPFTEASGLKLRNLAWRR
ncbi:hypothetical protein A9Q99_27355 [Gammaproteobacteria bacterium 45_16_T64]|nr:hypothetical protein A9Q99_27355 [Gammaproteobacteria bacterium 45_16_T64]